MSESVRIESAKGLKVYKVAYELAMEIFELTKKFSIGRNICVNESDSAFVAIDLFEPARSMGKTPV